MSDVLPFRKPDPKVNKTTKEESELTLEEQMKLNEENKKRVEKDRLKANRKVKNDYGLKPKNPKE